MWSYEQFTTKEETQINIFKNFFVFSYAEKKEFLTKEE
jgi:hypothetical protein